jgi:hypothetical protein
MDTNEIGFPQCKLNRWNGVGLRIPMTAWQILSLNFRERQREKLFRNEKGRRKPKSRKPQEEIKPETLSELNTDKNGV